MQMRVDTTSEYDGRQITVAGCAYASGWASVDEFHAHIRRRGVQVQYRHDGIEEKHVSGLTYRYILR